MKKGSLPAAVEEEEEQHLALKSSLTDWGKRRRRRKGYLSLSPPKRQTFAKFALNSIVEPYLSQSDTSQIYLKHCSSELVNVMQQQKSPAVILLRPTRKLNFDLPFFFLLRSRHL